MKKIILIFVITFSISCKSQVTQIVPLNSLRQDYGQNGVYFKDINNTLNNYEGTWEGVVNNKKYTFQLVKFTQQQHGTTNYYYEDEIKIKYRVIDLLNNQTLYDNLSAINYDDYYILGLSITYNSFMFWFQDNINLCYNSGKFVLQKMTGQPLQLKYCYFKYDYYENENCPNYTSQEQIPMFLPKQELVLTKQ